MKESHPKLSAVGKICSNCPFAHLSGISPLLAHNFSLGLTALLLLPRAFPPMHSQCSHSAPMRGDRSRWGVRELHRGPAPCSSVYGSFSYSLGSYDGFPVIFPSVQVTSFYFLPEPDSPASCSCATFLLLLPILSIDMLSVVTLRCRIISRLD